MAGRRTALALLLAALAAALAADRALAQNRRVIVRCLQIRATGEGEPKEIDRALEDLRPTLSRYRYRSFKLIGKESQDGPYGKAMTFYAAGLHTLDVVPGPAGSGRIALDVTLKRGKDLIVKTRVDIKDGKSVLIACELSAGEGVLFLGLTASLP